MVKAAVMGHAHEGAFIWKESRGCSYGSEAESVGTEASARDSASGGFYNGQRFRHKVYC